MATSLSTPKLSSTFSFQTLALCKKFPILPSFRFSDLNPATGRLSRSFPHCHRRFTTITRAETTNGVGSSDPSRNYDFDLFTIGAGSGGVRASRFAANFGASVAICELPFSTISSDTTGGVGGT